MPISKDSNNTKSSKRTYRTRSNSMSEERKLKKNADSDSSSSEEEDVESTYSDSEDGDEEEEEMDMQEYRKFVSKIFPSKFLKDKIKTIDAENKILIKV